MDDERGAGSRRLRERQDVELRRRARAEEHPRPADRGGGAADVAGRAVRARRRPCYRVKKPFFGGGGGGGAGFGAATGVLGLCGSTVFFNVTRSVCASSLSKRYLRDSVA